MPIVNSFKTCTHGDTPCTDYRECYMCLDEIAMQLTIARSYLKEIAQADFTDNGDCKRPVSEPVQGRHYTQIAATGLKQCS